MRRLLLGQLVLLGLIGSAWGTIWRCPDGTGGVIFQNEACDKTWGGVQVSPPTEPPALQPVRTEPPAEPYVAPSDPALAELFKALRKLDAAAEVGITKVEYGKLVVEAKAAANDALPHLRAGAFKRELQATMDAHAAALAEWDQWFRVGAGEMARYAVPKQWAEAKRHLQRASTLTP